MIQPIYLGIGILTLTRGELKEQVVIAGAREVIRRVVRGPCTVRLRHTQHVLGRYRDGTELRWIRRRSGGTRFRTFRFRNRAGSTRGIVDRSVALGEGLPARARSAYPLRNRGGQLDGLTECGWG